MVIYLQLPKFVVYCNVAFLSEFYCTEIGQTYLKHDFYVNVHLIWIFIGSHTRWLIVERIKISLQPFQPFSCWEEWRKLENRSEKYKTITKQSNQQSDCKFIFFVKFQSNKKAFYLFNFSAYDLTHEAGKEKEEMTRIYRKTG